MVKATLEQRAQEQETAGAIPTAGEPLDLPDNDGHFSIGVLDGERDLLPA